MPEVIEKFDYNLTSPIQVHKDGNPVDCWVLELYSPTRKQMRHITKLKQEVFKAVMAQSRSNTDNTDSSENNKDSNGTAIEDMPKEAVLMMLSYSETDLYDLILIFKNILINGLCKLNDNISMNMDHYDALSIEDLEGVFSEYVKNFLLSSLMKGLKKN